LLCYNVLEKGGVLEVNLNWTLKNNDKILIARKNQKALLEDKHLLIYKKDLESNKINLLEKKYLRETDEYLMEIDFKEKTCSFLFPKEGKTTFDIECKLNETEKYIEMCYKIDDNIKKIEINYNEV
jgi:hypothetical protein